MVCIYFSVSDSNYGITLHKTKFRVDNAEAFQSFIVSSMERKSKNVSLEFCLECSVHDFFSVAFWWQRLLLFSNMMQKLHHKWRSFFFTNRL